ncbi:MAG: fluoride efflux transporter CrcB [Gemmatimonadales bacterium]
MLWLFVALGGLVGSLARYFLGTAVQGWVGAGFPAGTMVVNITASFLIGLIMQYSVESSAITPEVRILLTTGFCGGYSTFSTFSWESVRLLQDGEWARAGLYVGGSLCISLVATFLGIAAAHHFIALRRAG